MPHPLSNKGYQFSRLSYDTLGACIDVQRQLGLHCMEVGYQRALTLALPKRGLRCQREVETPIAYDGVVVTSIDSADTLNRLSSVARWVEKPSGARRRSEEGSASG
jgi:hypothetical protein